MLYSKANNISAPTHSAATSKTAAMDRSSTPGTATAGWAMPLALAGLFLVLSGDITMGGALSIAALALSIEENATSAKRFSFVALLLSAVVLISAIARHYL